MRIANFLSLISCVGLTVGCSSTYPSSTYSSSSPPVYGGEIVSSGPYGATMVIPPQSQIEADRGLENSLRSQLNRYGDLAGAAPGVQIYAQNGTVTLTGTVPSTRDRDMIDSLVKNTSGVVAVNDQLMIGYPPTGVVQGPVRVYTTPPDYVVNSAPIIVASGNLTLTVQGTTLADRNLGQRVADRIRSDPNLTPLGSTINISVSDGRVYLRGTVDTEEQHLAIVSLVQHTYGVNAVYDQLLVR
jgi:osmotically-inducible protein OsmY